jgi:Uncharacterised nucleotidyltransferase
MPLRFRLPFDLATIAECRHYREADWIEVVSQGRRHGVSGRWYDLLESAEILDSIPTRVREHLWSDRLRAEFRMRTARWETNRLIHALQGTGIRLILLKGAAYLIRELAPGVGRMTADVDILVSHAELAATEAALNTQGWQVEPHSEYDDRYYREWMHELPPLRHETRGSSLDVHHNLLPRTNRLCPDPRLLLDSAWRVGETAVWTLSAPDLLIHSALHGFYSGEFTNCFRDILDIHELATDLSVRVPAFWPTLLIRTEQLNVGRAVFYALRYAQRYFGTAIPLDIRDASRAWGPATPLVVAMDGAIAAAFIPALPPNLWQRAALQALYIRSHWIKMPPQLLVTHLWTKYRMRRVARDDRSVPAA